jgi:hypothetical protein
LAGRVCDALAHADGIGGGIDLREIDCAASQITVHETAAEFAKNRLHMPV